MCPTSSKDLLQTIDGADKEDNCLALCRDVYPGMCKKYEYHSLEERCFLYRNEESASIKDCEKIGGPDYPDIDDCNQWWNTNSTDGTQECKVV